MCKCTPEIRTPFCGKLNCEWPDEEKVESITHAAIKSECGLILIGKCHADCFQQGRYTGIKLSQRAKDQGFMTSAGRYVDREDGARIAVSANQVNSSITFLFSEDLWSPHSGGKYKYDYVKGYYK
jgi:hypothetical protein